MDAFLSQARQKGQVSDVGLKFTVSGEKARERFLSSVPPGENTLFRGLMFLADALTALGAPPWKMVQFQQGMPLLVQVHGLERALPVLEKLGRDWFQERFHRPFASADRLAQDWDRAWVRLFSQGLSLSLQVKRSRKDPGWGFRISPKDGFEPYSGSTYQPTTMNSFLYLQRSLAPLERLTVLDGTDGLEPRLRFGRCSRHPVDHSRGLYSVYSKQVLAGNWFNYRARHLALYDRVVLHDQGGMALNLGQAPEGTSVEDGLWLLKAPGFWSRFRIGDNERIFSRRLVGPPELATGPQWARAYFTVGLHDGPAQVDLFDNLHSLETVTVPSGPPGLLGCVHWPDLKTDLWGQRYVRDEAWEAVLAFIQEQLEETWADLERLAGSLRAEILANRTKRAYRREVETKVNQLWFSRPEFLEAERARAQRPAAPTLTPEERAEEVRRRLKM